MPDLSITEHAWWVGQQVTYGHVPLPELAFALPAGAPAWLWLIAVDEPEAANVTVRGASWVGSMTGWASISGKVALTWFDARMRIQQPGTVTDVYLMLCDEQAQHCQPLVSVTGAWKQQSLPRVLGKDEILEVPGGLVPVKLYPGGKL